ncbi:oligosaccharide flippase family protein [Pseudomonas marginalis]|uniref:oligosaccharide flippase family protein n=1 Tax=Pseudomonas marginalis TaxID=298 RepID=UPI002033DE8F|nr:oligosaccharide flippase family protein [Pseudomonas marginalis]
MSIKKNVIANYASQIYTTLAGILMLPLYLKHMGAETYGLLGFFTMLQAWFNLLDLGLTPTISREAARLKADATRALEFRRLFRSLSVIFLGTAILGGGGIFLLAPYISNKWLNAEIISIGQVEFAVQVMGICVALRWMGGVYRGVISGVEQQVWLGLLNLIITTLRFIIVFPVMWYFGFTAKIFFVYQLFVAVLELIFLWNKSRVVLCGFKFAVGTIGWSIKPIKSVLKFSMTIAFTSSVWVFATQTDKLLLSKLLTLNEYGFFSLAVLVASTVMVVSGPISSAIMPRMANLYSQNKKTDVIDLYRKSTQLVSLFAGALTLTLLCAGDHLIYAWTGGVTLKDDTALIMKLYALGNGILAIGAFPYYLQYAKGDLKYHLMGNLMMITITLPATYFATTFYGAIGAGFTWLVINLSFLIFWVAYVHKKIIPGLHVDWLFKDVLRVLFPGVLISLLITVLDIKVAGVFYNLLYVACAALTVLLSMSVFAMFVSKLSIFDELKRFR